MVGPVGQTKVIAHSAADAATPATPPTLDAPPATTAIDEVATNPPAEPPTEPPAEEPPLAHPRNDDTAPTASAEHEAMPPRA
ncbi:MAG TPA: hypothetical protein VGS80_26205, partial [Ktedonobacterales bacterium]|nr:hypothetical protein [Ktedonobacterales bacterium]